MSHPLEARREIRWRARWRCATIDGVRVHTRLTASALLLALLAGASSARAQATPAERETAKRLMEQGRAKLEAKDPTAALAAFEGADAIVHVPTTGFMVATTQVELGRLIEARATLLRVIRSAKRPDEPKHHQLARNSAQELYDSLESRVPSLRVEVRGAGPDATVSIDGVALAPAALGSPVPVNPGAHVVVARSSSTESKQEVTVDEHETKDVLLDLVVKAPEPEPPRPQPPPPPSRPNPLPWIGFGVAGAGLIAGSVSGLLVLSKTSDLEASCANDQCPPSAHEDHATAYTYATISTVSFAVAAVGAGVGIYGLLSGKRSAAPSTSARVEPWVGPGGGGVQGSF